MPEVYWFLHFGGITLCNNNLVAITSNDLRRPIVSVPELNTGQGGAVNVTRGGVGGWAGSALLQAI